MAERIAVVLFNLGGPDRPEAVRPFLVNLFSDKAIIGLPSPFRGWLARLIAARRAPVARAIYAQIGGGSPLLAETEAQADALAGALAARGLDARCFIAMRYWHPRAAAAAAAVAAHAPTRLVLLPLYPQFSTTTTASSLAEWRALAAAPGLTLPPRLVCCYPDADGFIAAMAELTAKALAEAAVAGVPARLLFSAHGLPERVIAGGDPYAWQVQRTAAACVDRLRQMGHGDVDHVVCYQSRVGPLAWIGPSTEAELERAARDRRAAVVVPTAFVSEHSETLVELDIEYRGRAAHLGVPGYFRVPTVGVHPAFIAALAGLVVGSLSDGQGVAPVGGPRPCPQGFGGCPCPSPADRAPRSDGQR